MAKTNTKNNNRKSFLTSPIFIGLVVIVLVGVISGAIILLTSDGESEVVENNRKPSSIEQVDEQSSSKPDNVKPDVTQYEGENPNELNELTGQVRYVQQSDGFLVVSVMINQYLDGQGTCTMTLTGRKSGQVYTATSVIEADVTTSSCGLLRLGLQNAISDYYDIEIELEGDGKKGVIKPEGVEI